MWKKDKRFWGLFRGFNIWLIGVFLRKNSKKLGKYFKIIKENVLGLIGDVVFRLF